MYEDEEEESRQFGRDEANVRELDRLREAGDTAQITSLAARGLSDVAWEHAVGCLISLGELRPAWRLLLEVDGIGGACWRRTALKLGTAAVSVGDGDKAADRELAKTVAELLVERRHREVAAALLLEFAIADAQAAANRLASRRDQGAAADGADGAAHHDALFDRALEQMRKVVARSRRWRVPAGTVTRWNCLLRLVAKQRSMPRVFDVLAAMDALRMKKDAETYEFVSRAAVAAVSLQAIADSFETMPPPHFPEIVFLGRSNVGKSSLVNSLLNRKALAPVAATPGHTTRFFFYDVNKTRALFPRLTLVDVPGLGVAVTDQAQLDHWKSTLFHYLRERGPALRGIFHLVSAEAITKRHCLTDIDVEIAELAMRLSVEYTLVLTKVDNLRNKTGAWAVDVLERFSEMQGLSIDHAVTSSIKTRRGRDQLWSRLWSCVDPENPRWAGQDLLGAKRGLDDLVAAGAKEEVVARAAALGGGGDAWEYAVRCLISLGELRAAWQAVTDALDSEEKLSPLQERAALAVGEAALRVGDAGALADEGLAEEVCARLEASGSQGARAELLLEWAVALAHAGAAAARGAGGGVEDAPAPGVPDGGSALERSLELLRRVVSNAQDGGGRPWSIDRWNRLVQWTLRRRDLPSLAAVLDAMAELRMKENDETREIIAQTLVTSVKLVEAEKAEQAYPEVAFIEASWASEEEALLLDTLLLESSAAHTERGGRPAGLVARALELNAGAVDAGIPPMTCLDVPLAAERLDASPSAVCADIRALISRPRAQPFSVLQVISAESFVWAMRAEVPNRGALGHRLEVEEPQWTDTELSLSAEDLAVQAAALEGGASRYTLVLTHSDELGSEPRKRKDKVKLSRAHPRVIQERKDLLAERLLQAATAAAPGVDIKILLVDTRTGEGLIALWRRLWECALPPSARLAAEEAAEAAEEEAEARLQRSAEECVDE